MYLHCQYSTGGRSDMLENREKSAHKYFVTTDILVINFKTGIMTNFAVHAEDLHDPTLGI